jgi:hypothetical protein
VLLVGTVSVDAALTAELMTIENPPGTVIAIDRSAPVGRASGGRASGAVASGSPGLASGSAPAGATPTSTAASAPLPGGEIG